MVVISIALLSVGSGSVLLAVTVAMLLAIPGPTTGAGIRLEKSPMSDLVHGLLLSDRGMRERRDRALQPHPCRAEDVTF